VRRRRRSADGRDSGGCSFWMKWARPHDARPAPQKRKDDPCGPGWKTRRSPRGCCQNRSRGERPGPFPQGFMGLSALPTAPPHGEEVNITAHYQMLSGAWSGRFPCGPTLADNVSYVIRPIPIGRSDALGARLVSAGGHLRGVPFPHGVTTDWGLPCGFICPHRYHHGSGPE
jgi:hypothetical protein